MVLKYVLYHAGSRLGHVRGFFLHPINEGWALGTGENRPIAEREAGTEIAV